MDVEGRTTPGVGPERRCAFRPSPNQLAPMQDRFCCVNYALVSPAFSKHDKGAHSSLFPLSAKHRGSVDVN